MVEDLHQTTSTKGPYSGNHANFFTKRVRDSLCIMWSSGLKFVYLLSLFLISGNLHKLYVYDMIGNLVRC